MESDLFTLLKAICPRVFPDVAPTGTLKPYVTWQQIGGQVLNPLDNSVPGKRNAVIQINVWSTTRIEANALINQIEDAMRPFPARPASASFSDYDNDMLVYSAQQEFDLWR
jgi:hypothetical protein